MLKILSNLKMGELSQCDKGHLCKPVSTIVPNNERMSVHPEIMSKAPFATFVQHCSRGSNYTNKEMKLNVSEKKQRIKIPITNDGLKYKKS